MIKIKRPLTAAAAVFAVLCFAAAYFCPELLMPSFAKNEQALLEDGDSLAITGKIYKTQTKTYSVYVYLKNAKAAAEGGQYSKAGNVIVCIAADDYESYGLKIGNTITARCTYSEFENARNNGNYDEENYYKSLGIFLKAEVSSLEITSLTVNIPAQAMALLKERIIESFDEILGDDEEAVKGIFMAVILGDRSSLTDGTKSLYSENGIAHILAVSGLHISIIGMGLFSLLKKYLGPYKSGVICSIVMFLYCLMCGFSVSALRAVIMFMVHMAAYFFGKTYDLLSALSLAAIIILLSNPFYILNSGFILSFSAILSIGIVGKNLTEFLKPEKGAAKALLSGACITLTSLPAVAGTYYTVPVYGVLLNIIVIPLMSFVLGSGLAGGLFGMVSAFIGRFFIGLGYYTVYFINLCCYLTGFLWPGCIVTGCPGIFKTIVFYGILCTGIFIVRKINLKSRENPDREILKPALRLAAVLAVMAALFLVICINFKENELEIIMFDVDQGDGILIKTPEGTVILIDGGSTGEDELWEYRLESALEYEGISAIDYSIITHPDTDHISGILDLLADETTPVKIKNMLIPYVEDNESYEELISAAAQAGVNVINIYSGMAVKTGSVTLTCIHPDEGSTYEDSNDYSAVISLEYGEFTALFTGDIGQEVELDLLESGSLGENYSLLKVAHHGSKYSSCEKFLAQVSPKAAIISAGEDNSYGHPAQETLTRLEAAGADIYVTADVGEIKITADKEGNMDIWTKF